MADELNGSGTPTQSPGENQPPESNLDANNLGDPSIQEPSVEQVEWNKLSGKSQERFSAVIRERNRLAQEKLQMQAQLDEVKTQPMTQPQYNQPQGGMYRDPREEDVNRAVDTLKQKGFTTVDEVRDLVNEVVGQTTQNINIDREHEKLENKYNSLSNAPRYSREEVEDYGRRNRIFNLEAAYRDMYWDELHDLDRAGSSKKPPVSERPGASNMSHSSDNEPMSLDELQAKLKGPQGREWYEEQMQKNPKKFQGMVAQLTQS